ncbi:MAG TPA: DUF4124 domain-containing protein, partial [Planctomycetota bacterium]|nr:DUF4124 domain-containing protein [Planctomycetota bacterium]
MNGPLRLRLPRALAGAALLLVVVALAPRVALAQLYRWTDDSGTVHLADDLNQIPEAYRRRAEHLRSVSGDSRPRADVRSGAEARRAVAPHERWRGRALADWQGDLRDSAPRTRVAAPTRTWTSGSRSARSDRSAPAR